MNFMQSYQKKNIVNIMLCNSHKLAFHNVYKKTIAQNIAIIENDYILENLEFKDTIKSKSITIGHLSNLSFAKGLNKVIDVFELFKNDGNVIFDIAGPAMDDEAKNLLNEFAEKYPANFIYRGPLYGAAKDEWYSSIDIFLFPTNYNAETYPLVILEAVLHNVVPLTTSIGCLCEINNQLFISDYPNFQNHAENFYKAVQG